MVQIPRLPSVDVQTGQVVPVQAPQVRPMQDFSAEQIGQLGEGMMRAGRGAVRYAAYQQRQKEIEDAENAENIAMQSDMAFRDHLDNELNPENGYLSKVGPEAIDGYKPLLQNAEKKAQEIEDSLDSELAKKMFRREANRKLLAFKADASKHYYNKRQTFRVGLMQAEADAAKGDATRYLNTFDADPSEVPDEYKALMVDKDGKPRQVTPYQFNLEKFQAYLRRAGGEAQLDSTQIESAVAKATSDMHAESLDALIDQDPERAQAYFEKYQDGIDPKLHSAVSQKIESASLSKFGREYSEAINAEIDPNTGPGTKLEIGLNAARAALDSGDITEKQFDAVEDNLLKISQRASALQRQQQTDATESIQDFADKNGIGSWEELEKTNKKLADEANRLGLKRLVQGYLDSGKQFVTQKGAYDEMAKQTQEYWLSLKTETDVKAQWRKKLNNEDLNDAIKQWRVAHNLASDKEKSDMTRDELIGSSWNRLIAKVGKTDDQVKALEGTKSAWVLDRGSYQTKIKEMIMAQGREKGNNRPWTVDDTLKLLDFVENDVVTTTTAEGKELQVPSVMLGVTPGIGDETTAVIKIGGRAIPYGRITRINSKQDEFAVATPFPDEESNPAVREFNKRVDSDVRRGIDKDRTADPTKRFTAREIGALLVATEDKIRKQDKAAQDAIRAKSVMPIDSRASKNPEENKSLGSQADVLLWETLLNEAHEKGGTLSEDKLAQVEALMAKDSSSFAGMQFGTSEKLRANAFRDAYSNDLVALKVLSEVKGLGGRAKYYEVEKLYKERLNDLRESAQKILRREGNTVPVEDAVILTGMSRDELLDAVRPEDRSYGNVSGERVYQVMSAPSPWKAAGRIEKVSDVNGNVFLKMKNDFSWEVDGSDLMYAIQIKTGGVEQANRTVKEQKNVKVARNPYEYSTVLGLDGLSRPQ